MTVEGNELRPVPDFPGYSVDRMGNVYSHRRKVHRGWVIDPAACRKLKPKRHLKGYLCVTLHRGGKQITRTAHSLALEAFRGPRPVGAECCHGNGVRDDNRVENLRYGTRSENQRDRVLHGTQSKGSRNGRAKLTELETLEVKTRLAWGESLTSIARSFNAPISTINNIKRGTTWSWLTTTTPA